jgi:Concanavalin A-like lectin/glucanases superfamily
MVPADLTDFTVVLDQSFASVLTSVDGPLDADGAAPMLSDGGDIRASSDSAGTTELAVDVRIVSLNNDPSLGKIEIAVKVPSVSSSANTTFYVWWGNSGATLPAATDTYGQHAAYDSNYLLVLPFSEDPAGSAPQYADRTATGVTGTVGGAANVSRVSGKPGYAVNFAAGGVIWLSAGPSYLTANRTVSFLHTPALGAGDISRTILAPGAGGGLWLYIHSTEKCLDLWSSATGDQFETANFTAGVKVHSAVTIDGSGNCAFFRNAAANGTGSGWTESSTAAHGIGSDNSGGTSDRLNGSLDELRVSSAVRSSAWITAEYNNFLTANFLTFGSIVDVGLQTIFPNGVASAATFGSPSLAPASIALVPSAVASAAAVGSPSPVPGAVAISPVGIASSAAIGGPSLLQVVAIRPNGIASSAAVGAPFITPGSVTIGPTGISPPEAIGTPALSEASVFPTGWTRRISLTIDHTMVPSNLSNFTVVFDQSFASALTSIDGPLDADGSGPMLSGGGDVRCSSDSAGATQLAVDVRRVALDNDPSLGKMEIAVKIPTLSSTADTVFYVWWGKAGVTQPAASDAYGQYNAYDGNYDLVLPLTEDPGGSAPQYHDRTSHAGTGTVTNPGDLSAVAGKIGDALSIDTAGGYVSAPFETFANGYSFSAIIKINQAASSAAARIYGGDTGFGLQLGATTDHYRMLNSGPTIDLTNTNALSDATWYHVALRLDPTTLYFFTNGAADGSAAYSGSVGGGKIGYANLVGVIDEIRHSANSRSQAWFQVEYANFFTAGFITFGSIVNLAGATVSPNGIGSSAAAGSPALSAGLASILPNGIASSASLGTPGVSSGAMSVFPNGIDSSVALGTPALSIIAQTIHPNGIASANAAGTPKAFRNRLWLILADSDASTGDIHTEQLAELATGAEENARVTTINGPGAALQLLIGGTESVTWLSPPLKGFTLSGNMSMRVDGSESDGLANAAMVMRISRYANDGTFIEDVLAIPWATPPGELEVGQWYGGLNQSAVAPDAPVTFNDGDRIGVRIYAVDASGLTMAAGYVVTMSYNGDYRGEAWLQIAEDIFLWGGAVAPNGIASSASAGTPTLSESAIALSPAGIASASTAGTPSLAPPSRTVSPNGIASSAALTSPAFVKSWFVSPTGSGSGDGSFANPWDLQTALNQPASLHAGDTIFLRGGTYSGVFDHNLNGTESHPFIVRSYPTEWAVLDGGSAGANYAVINLKGSYTYFRDFEIMSSDPTRVTSTSGSNPPDIVRPDGVRVDQSGGDRPGIKCINLIVHDTRQGFSSWAEGIDLEVYGCLVYFNGWYCPTDRGHGHGMYVQNDTGSVKNTDECVFFDGFGEGTQAYSTSGPLKYIRFKGSVFFDNGIGPGGYERNLLLGSGAVSALDCVIDSCFMAKGPVCLVGYSGLPATNPTIIDNYFNAQADILDTTMTLTGNLFYGSTADFNTANYPDNTYQNGGPGTVDVFVRPNAYDRDRSHVLVFNWPSDTLVDIDPSSVLNVGDAYELRNVQDYFGTPAASGIYSGAPISVDMTALTVASPVGYSAPASTGPTVGVFVLLRLSAISVVAIGSSAAAGSPSLSAGSISISPVGIASAAAAGTPAASAGLQIISPVGITSAQAFGTPSLAPSASISPTGIATSAACGSPGMAASASISPSGAASSAAAGTPIVSAGLQSLHPVGIASSAAAGSPGLSSAASVFPSSIASGAVAGSPGLALATISLVPVGISPSEAPGTPNVGPPPAAIYPGAIASSAATGTPALAPLAASVAASGIPSSAAPGSPSLAGGAAPIAPDGIASASAAGSPSLGPLAVVSPSGIASSAAAGSPSLAPALHPDGIASSELLGSPALLPGAVTLDAPAGIASASAPGTPRLLDLSYILPIYVDAEFDKLIEVTLWF